MPPNIKYDEVLPRDETIRLIQLVHDPSESEATRAAARETLFLANRRLIDKAVSRYTSPRSDRESAFQAGAIGLLDAIDRIDPEKAGAFYSYFSSYIHGEIAAYGREMSLEISLRDHKGRQAKAISKEIGLMRAEGVEYDARAVAERLGLPLHIVVEIFPWVTPGSLRSLDLPTVNNGDFTVRRLEIPDEGSPMIAAFDEVLDTLPDEEADAVFEYFEQKQNRPPPLVALAFSRILHPSRQWMLYAK